MTSKAEAFAAAAEAQIGTPFKLHGRNPEYGLDCVGLVLVALEKTDLPTPILPRYALRNSNYSSLLSHAQYAGFTQADGPSKRGDMIIVTPGPAQLHLMISTEPNSFVHAHAGLRKIVATHGPLLWPVKHHLRLSQKG